MHNQELAAQFEHDIKENELLLLKVCNIYAYTVTDRQDLFQEIAIQLWKAYPNYKGAAKFSTWLYRVAINTAISGFRKQKDFIRSFEPSALPAHQIDSTDYADNEDKLKQMYAAIAKLSEVEKAIVMLYMEDRSYEEMEDILGVSQGSLRVRMNRIKTKLRELTKSYDYGT